MLFPTVALPRSGVRHAHPARRVCTSDSFCTPRTPLCCLSAGPAHPRNPDSDSRPEQPYRPPSCRLFSFLFQICQMTCLLQVCSTLALRQVCRPIPPVCRGHPGRCVCMRGRRCNPTSKFPVSCRRAVAGSLHRMPGRDERGFAPGAVRACLCCPEKSPCRESPHGCRCCIPRRTRLCF